LDAANAIIKKNSVRREKNLFTENISGEKISIFSAYDEAAEAYFIASKAEEAIRSGVSPEEIAVLYRANFQSRILEEAFMTKNIPYQILGTRFFERKEVKDLISYLRAALDPESLSDLKRIINIPARGLGKTAVAKIFSGAEDSLPANTRLKYKNFKELLYRIKESSEQLKLSEVFSFIIKETGLEKEWKEGGDGGAARLENAYELVNFASRYDELEKETGVETFLADAALQSDQDELKETNKATRLMTVHASKGLEFDTVFISGLEDGLFPHQRINKNDMSREEAEEERRLFYVALTRAKKKVFLTYAQVRTIFGRRQSNIPSEFIFDIPEELTSEENSDGIDMPRKPLLEIEF
jgi:DNA helicase-2/ATP-dependent DNA helicase PcrA